MKHDFLAAYNVSEFSSALYNSMTGVEGADAEVRRSDRLTTALSVLRPLFERHGTSKYCGINLLHRHWRLDADELPEQIRSSTADETALVTRPVRSSSAVSAYPASWALAGGTARTFLPFEFATDPLARECVEELKTKPEFFDEVGRALADHGLQHHFGVCVALRERLSDDPTAELVETTESGRRSRITARTLSKTERKSSIQTVWVFADGKARESACETACFAPTHCVQIIRFPPNTTEHDSVSSGHEKQHEVGPA